AKDWGIKSVAHVYIDGYWYLVFWNIDGKYWAAVNGEPTMLMRYCGPADKLGDAVAEILRGEEVVVPAMVRDNLPAVEQRRARVKEVRDSLQILGNQKENIDGDRKPGPAEKKPGEKKPDDKKPEDPKPGEKKPEIRNPDRVGTVKAVAADGKSFTLLPAPTEKNKEPAPVEIQITEGTKIVADKEAGKLAVGQTVSVWLQPQKGGSSPIAEGNQIGKPPEKPEDKKPVEKKPDDKKPALSGTVKAVAADGKDFTLQPSPTKTDPQPAAIDIRIGEKTRITSGKEP